MKLQENRQKLSFLILIIAVFMLPMKISAQKQNYQNCIYAKRSNIIDPDTLKPNFDEYKIFWHFVKLTYKQLKELEPLEIKAEFKKIGITTKENDRFVDAYSFFDTRVIGHKKSCENIQHFDFLKPKQ